MSSFEDSDMEEDARYEMREDLADFLKGTTSAGTFSTFGNLTQFAPPGIYIPNMSEISVPVSNPDIEKLISQGKQAPVGKNRTTVVDTTIRKTRELQDVEFRNPAWDGFLRGLVSQVSEALGIEGEVFASFYKLLVYEEGAMFKAHREYVMS